MARPANTRRGDPLGFHRSQFRVALPASPGAWPSIPRLIGSPRYSSVRTALRNSFRSIALMTATPAVSVESV